MPTPRGAVLPSGGRKVIGGLDAPDPYAGSSYIYGLITEVKDSEIIRDVKPWTSRTISKKVNK
jgi:hypothetical protein